MPRPFQWQNVATAWCMRRQNEQAKMESRAMPATSSKRLMRWRISPTLKATKSRDGASFPGWGWGGVELDPHGHQESEGEHGQRDVAIPAVPGANLVVVQADFLLGDFEAFLDRPAHA